MKGLFLLNNFFVQKIQSTISLGRKLIFYLKQKQNFLEQFFTIQSEAQLGHLLDLQLKIQFKQCII